MIGDPSGTLRRAESAGPGDARGEPRRRSARSWSASSTSSGPHAARSWSTTSTGSASRRCWSSCATSASTSRSRTCSPRTRSRSRLGRRPVVHRVQLHAPPGGRLPAPVPDVRRRAADGRRRPVGQHHRGPRADPPDGERARRRGRATSPTRSRSRSCSTRAARSSARPPRGTSVWLDAERTTPYAFYQYWLGQGDADVGRSAAVVHAARPAGDRGAGGASRPRAPEERPAQRALALEVTTRVHGREAAQEAERQSREVFSGGLLSPERSRLPGGDRGAAAGVRLPASAAPTGRCDRAGGRRRVARTARRAG